MDGGGGRWEGLCGVTLGYVLGKDKDRSLRVNRTLLDIIRQEEPNCRAYENIINSHHGSKKSWKIFKDKRRLIRAAEVPVPVSDVADEMVSTSDATVMGVGSVGNQRPALAQLLRDQSTRIVEQVQEDDDSGEVPRAATGEVQSLNQYLSRVRSSSEDVADQENASHFEHVPVSDAPVPVPDVNNRSSMPMHNLSRIPSAEQLDQPVISMRLSEALAAERQHTHTHTAVSSLEPSRSAAQHEAEGTETNSHSTERVQINAEVTNEEPQVRMSLMDLLEDTDSRQIGWPSSSYPADVDYYTGNINEVNESVEEERSNFVEQNCCVCMVRHKGSAFIPCGHTFCRLCSRELWVNRGNCPICNGFILEILDIF